MRAGGDACESGDLRRDGNTRQFGDVRAAVVKVLVGFSTDRDMTNLCCHMHAWRQASKVEDLLSELAALEALSPNAR